jgi:hypothetical protein
MPIPASEPIMVVAELRSPISPIPAGSRNTATNLVRIIPAITAINEEPPINTDDFRIWP